MTREFIDFVKTHEHEDTARLLLSAARYPSVDMPLAVQQIEGRRTAREKWPSLLEHDDYLYPPRLNREQSSSEATAHYKATLAVGSSVVADLTGGMGIDTLAMARSVDEMHYVERDAGLCDLMRHNCGVLGMEWVEVHQGDSLQWLEQSGIVCDLIYIDPARRDGAGRKTVAFEDCRPNILRHLSLLRSRCTGALMVKASPMIDINAAIGQLGTVCEVHIVAVRGECKEVLFVCGKEAGQEPAIHCVDIAADGTFDDFTFTRSEEQVATATYCTEMQSYLYEPHAALMKGGPFRLIAQRLSMAMLAPNSHLYTSDRLEEAFPGRIFEVLRELPLKPRAIREAIPDGRAHVVERNFPTEAATLQRQLGLREGGELFVIATTMGNRRCALLARMKKNFAS